MYVHVEKWNFEECTLNMISDNATLPENIMNLIHLSTMLLTGGWRSSLHCYNNLAHNTFPCNAITSSCLSKPYINILNVQLKALLVQCLHLLPHRTHSTTLSEIQCLYTGRGMDPGNRVGISLCPR